jgi:fumarate reductase subunit C
MGSWNYLKFIIRELTSLAVAWTVVLLLWLMYSLSQGEAAYRDFMDLMRSPLLIVINLIAFLLAVYHSVTWFNLAPTALVVRVGGKRVPAPLIALPHFAAWLVASVVIAWLIIRGL